MSEHEHDEGCEHEHDEENTNHMTGPNDKSSRIWIGGFDDALAKTFAERVFSINAQDENRPIVLYINSPGGCADAMLSMQAVMDSVQNTFVTVAVGQASSAGALLLAHGDIRFVSPYSRVMIHEISAGASGHIEDLETSMKNLVAVNDIAIATLAKNMGKTLVEVREIFKKRGRNMYLTPEETVELGIADHIGIPSIKEVPIQNMKYEISLSTINKTGTQRRAKVLGKVLAKIKKSKK